MPEDAGQWVSSRAERFRFDAGGDAFDLVYTTPFVTAFGDFVADVPLGEWLRERYPDIQGEIGDRELVDADALRSAIKGIAVALARGTELRSEDIDAVNVYAATPDIPPVLAGSSRQAGRTGIRTGQALSAMAREAIRMFGPEGRERVRECSADDCQLVFYDDSRAGSRRWCSMQRCGNRAKVRAFRARTYGP